MNIPKRPTNKMDKFNVNDTVTFRNKNTGYVLEGKVKGKFNCENEFLGMELEGTCLNRNDNRINVSWFNLDDIEFL